MTDTITAEPEPQSAEDSVFTDFLEELIGEDPNRLTTMACCLSASVQIAEIIAENGSEPEALLHRIKGVLVQQMILVEEGDETMIAEDVAALDSEIFGGDAQ